MLLRGALAARHDRLLEAIPVHLHAGADLHVVDRDARVLAQEVVRVFGHADVPDHRAEYRLARGVRLGAIQSLEACLDVRRQYLERADVQLLRGLSTCFDQPSLVTGHWSLVTALAACAPSPFRPALRLLAYRFPPELVRVWRCTAIPMSSRRAQVRSARAHRIPGTRSMTAPGRRGPRPNQPRFRSPAAFRRPWARPSPARLPAVTTSARGLLLHKLIAPTGWA